MPSAISDMAKKVDNYGTIERAVSILKAFIPQNLEMGTIELSNKLDINKSTVSRIMKVMVSHQLIYQDPKSKKFVLGNLALDIGNAAIRSINTRLVSIAKPHIDQLRDKVNEPVALEVLSGNSTMLAYFADTKRLLRVSFDVGMRMPSPSSAGAKAILAFSSQELLDVFIGDGLRRLTANTITDTDAYKRHLEEVRKNGVASDRGEIDEDIHTLAAPVFDHENKAVAAVVVAVPVNRKNVLEGKKDIALLKKAAKSISQEFEVTGTTS